MNNRKENHELDCGNAFIKWFNNRSGTNYSYTGRAGEAPDLIYKDGKVEIKIEHTAAYYDSTHAAFINKNPSPTHKEKEPWTGSSSDFDKDLVNEIENRIIQKSVKDYGSNCVLLIEVPPSGTAVEDLEKQISYLDIDKKIQNFIGVYVAGRFSITLNSSGGFRVITIKEIPNRVAGGI